METVFPVRDYDLAATLNSGQSFRWLPQSGGWEGVVGRRWVRLTGRPDGIHALATGSVPDWRWLVDYLQCKVDLGSVINTFPTDPHLAAAVAACRGLRLLRQEPWECLASFILSSTKQIVQIRQIVGELCARFGEPVAVPGDPWRDQLHESHDETRLAAGDPPGSSLRRLPAGNEWFSFPSAARVAACKESELRACKMGFRAPYLLAAARMVADGTIKLGALGAMDCEAARAELERIPGVGRKIADCVLLFACGFQRAFPVDVWVRRALRQLYFPRRRVTLAGLERFTTSHFGPYAGYAQQYLFHYMRLTHARVR